MEKGKGKPGQIIRLSNNKFVARKQNIHDCYETAAWCTKSLYDRLPELKGPVLEPCCGAGSICREHKRLRPDLLLLPSDLRSGPQIYGIQGVDFLADNCLWKPGCARWAVINPPFRKSTEFLVKALSLVTEGVCIFQRTQWLESKGRYRDIWSKLPLARVYFFVNRVGCFQEGEMVDPKEGGMLAFAWYIFIKGHKGPGTMHWINDQPDFTHDTRLQITREQWNEIQLKKQQEAAETSA